MVIEEYVNWWGLSARVQKFMNKDQIKLYSSIYHKKIVLAPFDIIFARLYDNDWDKYLFYTFALRETERERYGEMYWEGNEGRIYTEIYICLKVVKT